MESENDRLKAENDRLKASIQNALAIAGNHYFDWGERAIDAFNELEKAVKVSGVCRGDKGSE